MKSEQHNNIHWQDREKNCSESSNEKRDNCVKFATNESEIIRKKYQLFAEIPVYIKIL